MAVQKLLREPLLGMLFLSCEFGDNTYPSAPISRSKEHSWITCPKDFVKDSDAVALDKALLLRRACSPEHFRPFLDPSNREPGGMNQPQNRQP